jgi:2-alkyl-3-oxoalkanoate reductase
MVYLLDAAATCLLQAPPRAPNQNLHPVADSVIVFLTGAAGLLGGEMAARLVGADHQVIGLIRRSREICGNDGRILSAKPFDGSLPEPGQIISLSGDVTMPDFGLDAIAIAALANKVELVVHCAAITDFNASEQIYRRVNIGGVRNIAALFPSARMLHVSTAYVCGLKNGAVREAERDPGYGFVNGYERSKAEGEKYVRMAGNRAVIARPSIVIGSHSSGELRSFDTFYQFFRLIAEGRIKILPVSTSAALDFVPIDHVAGGLMDIIAHWNKAAGKTIHLSSGAPTPVAMLADAIGRFAQLDRPRLIAPSDFSLDALPPLERRLYKHFAAVYSSYFQRNPQFETHNLKALSGRICPPMDAAALDRMITYCIDQNFIRVQR